MHVKKQVRWAAIILFVFAMLWPVCRQRMYSPENRLARALHDLGQPDSWGRKLHQEIWKHLPQIVDEYAAGLAPIPLRDVHRGAVQELSDLAPQSKEAVQVLIEAAMENPDPEVSRTAIIALGHIGPFASAAINFLLTFDIAPYGWTSNLFEALCAIGPNDPRVTAALLKHVEFDQPFSEPVLSLLEKYATGYSQEVRTEALELYEAREDLRGGLTLVIGRIPGPPDQRDTFVLACLRDRDVRVRCSALQLLIEKPSDDPAVLAELRNALLD